MENTCINCGISIPFYESGLLTVKGNEELDISSLSFSGTTEPDNKYRFIYNDFDQLLLMLKEFDPILSRGSWGAGISNGRNTPRVVPFHDFYKRMHKRDAVEFIQTGKLISHFQPIIQLQDDQLFGFESLLRSGMIGRKFHLVSYFKRPMRQACTPC
ncbi:hypothetical protein [Bacillus sp. AK031]